MERQYSDLLTGAQAPVLFWLDKERGLCYNINDNNYHLY